MRRLFAGMIARHRKLILEQVLAIAGLMHLLMKVRNTGVPWTDHELARIRAHLRRIARLVPLFLVFLLPGGLLLLPILTEVLDRRSARR